MLIRYTLYFFAIIVNSCSASSSSSFLEKLRRQKEIVFQSALSSPTEFSVNEGSQFRLTCAFLSSFDKIDIFWFHNGTLLQSFISETIQEEEDDEVENSFLAATILSTIEIKKIHFDMNGLYQCVGIHKEIYAQQTFHIHVIINETNPIKENFSEHPSIIVQTHQSLFEPRSHTTLMCRVDNNRKNECTIQWFDPQDEPVNMFDEKTDLVLSNANFDDDMGLYSCQICCHNQCQTLTTFVYPAAAEQ